LSARHYTLKPTARALTPTGGFLKGFAFSLNPYIGCAFGDSGGCPYCYVRMLPIARVESGSWGSWVIAKSNLAARLEHELAALDKKDRLGETTIFMSSATDPYQGIERRLCLTRAALEAFVRHPIRRLLIQTRSPLIERDIEIIATLGDRAIVSLTLETDDDNVRRAITPTSPSIERRLKTARMFRARGIFVQLAISPMLPNNPERFAELAAAASNRVIIDTYFDGDGANGARSRALGMRELYAKHGYEEWFQPGAERALVDAMTSRLGADRVLMSRHGFTAV
jgi:DNA repair photolyase